MTRALDQYGVPNPCPVSWNAMTGTDVTRTCATCARQVHDLGAMTADEAEALVTRTDARICVRYVRGADGAILTRDRRANLIQKSPYKGLSAAALAAAVALLHVACSPATQGTPDDQTARVRPETTGPMGTLSGLVSRVGDDAQVVVISETTGEEFVVPVRKGTFAVEVPEGRYTVSVDGESDLTTPDGVSGVEVRARQTATIELNPGIVAMGEVIRIYSPMPPSPLLELRETPAADVLSAPTASAWDRFVAWAQRLFR